MPRDEAHKRKIAVITTSRADYSHLYWPLRDLAAHPDIDLRLIVAPMSYTPRQTESSILDQIHTALSEEFRRSLVGMENLYGDGHAAETIVKVLACVPLNEELLIKRA